MNHFLSLDANKCVGCYACIIACGMAHDLPPIQEDHPVDMSQQPTPIRVEESMTQLENKAVVCSFTPIACRHCKQAQCIEACPESALYKEDVTGIVLVNEDDCTGCELCYDACPYNVPQFYDEKLVKCDLCIKRLKQSRKPACEHTCPSGAISFLQANKFYE